MIMLRFYLNNNQSNVIRTTSVQRLAAIASEKVQALPATAIQTTPKGRRKQLRIFSFFSYFSFSFSSQQKRKKSTFLFQNNSSFSFLYCEERKENEAKEKK